MIKKQSVLPLVLLLLMAVVFTLKSLLSGLVNPDNAAGHPNYARNYQLLSLLRNSLFFASLAVVVVLWIVVCVLVIRSKNRSLLWLSLAAFGPVGFAVLASLDDRAPDETDRYARFVRTMNGFVRVLYELCTFAVFWVLAYQAMVVKRNLMIAYQAAATGMSAAQIIDIQNASSGMWAFSEGNEVMYFVILLYLLRPILVSLVGQVASTRSPRTP